MTVDIIDIFLKSFRFFRRGGKKYKYPILLKAEMLRIPTRNVSFAP
jgi:hypothetical protein